MLRGEFRRGDGLLIPNNITSRGAEKMLARCFTYQDTIDPSNDSSDQTDAVALVSGLYTPTVQFANLNEPTLGVGGYQRAQITRGPAGWSIQKQVNNEWYAETLPFTFTPTGSGYDKPSTQLCFTEDNVAEMGIPWSISSSFPEITMTPTTDINLRTFTYRIYLR